MGTITLQFRGIHPTWNRRPCLEWVPLHYSSGASIRPVAWIASMFTDVPLHYSSGASIRHLERLKTEDFKYHYITVPGHPSDSRFGLQTELEFGTITLQFRGIHPTYDVIYTLDDVVPLHYSSGASIRQNNRCNICWCVPLHYSSGASIRLTTYFINN